MVYIHVVVMCVQVYSCGVCTASRGVCTGSSGVQC